MILDKTNFDAEFESFKKALDESDFIAFDLEMSGIKTDDNRSGNDLPSEYYYKSKTASSKYGIIQFGVSCFKKTEDGLMSKPFNFYTFPRPINGKFNRDVCLNSDCVSFHEKVGTDMARWIYKGVNYFQYVTLDTVERIVVGGSDENKSDSGQQGLADNLKAGDKDAYAKHKEGYLEWAKGEDQTIGLTDNRGYIRKCLYRLIEDETPNFYFTVQENPTNWKEKTINVVRATKEEKEAYKDEIEKKKRAEYDQVIGFSRVWLELINYKKPVVGHNLFFDLLFSFEHYHQNNPFTFSKFKETVNQCWPMLYDTKILSSEFGREDISGRLNLEELYTKLQEITQIKVKVAEGFTDYTTGCGDVFHDAGYDAFATGSCYYMLSKLEGSDDVLERFLNKVRMGTSKMFLADFGDANNDVITADKMHIIAIVESTKESEKGDAVKVQTGILDSLKEDFKKNMVYSMQNNPPVMYQRATYISYFFGFDKKHQSEFLSIKNTIKEQLKKANLESAKVLDLKDYVKHFTDMIKVQEKSFQKVKDSKPAGKQNGKK